MRRTPADLEEGEHVPGQLTIDDAAPAGDDAARPPPDDDDEAPASREAGAG